MSLLGPALAGVAAAVIALSLAGKFPDLMWALVVGAALTVLVFLVVAVTVGGGAA